LLKGRRSPTRRPAISHLMRNVTAVVTRAKRRFAKLPAKKSSEIRRFRRAPARSPAVASIKMHSDIAAMPRSRRVSLRDAVASGATELLVYCEAMGCEHVSTVPMDSAIIRWGLDRKLDDIATACAACGSRLVEARFAWPVSAPAGDEARSGNSRGKGKVVSLATRLRRMVLTEHQVAGRNRQISSISADFPSAQFRRV
jgi:hypothetical protein